MNAWKLPLGKVPRSRDILHDGGPLGNRSEEGRSGPSRRDDALVDADAAPDFRVPSRSAPEGVGKKGTQPVAFGTTLALLSNVATRLHLVGLGAAFDKLKTCRHGGQLIPCRTGLGRSSFHGRDSLLPCSSSRNMPMRNPLRSKAMRRAPTDEAAMHHGWPLMISRGLGAAAEDPSSLPVVCHHHPAGAPTRRNQRHAMAGRR